VLSRRKLTVFFSVVALSLSSVAHPSEVPLPTPLEHYETYDPVLAGLAIASAILPRLDPDLRARVLAAMQTPDAVNSEAISETEILAAMKELEWNKWRPEIVELFLHQSRVLEVIPESAEDWVPLVHDSLLLFLDRLSEERFVERLMEQVRLPRDADRGDLVLAFLAKTPSLQKLGQILARNPALAPDLRQALQTLENSIVTTDRDEMVQTIEDALGEDVVSRYHIHFAEDVLAEASVGAVIRATLIEPGEQVTQQAVCKVLKPYAIKGLQEELEILVTAIQNLQDNGDFYDIGATPVVALFREIRDALSKEIQVTEEQQNLVRAAEYYKDQKQILIPEIYAFSTPTVTCMEFVHGVKITDAYPGDPEARAKLARHLSDALTFDVLFSDHEDALFHGDPHAGNVLHVIDGSEAPYRIALIDWGLSEVFPKTQREQLIQLLVGLSLGNPKRLANNLSALVELDEPSPAREQTISDLVDRVLTYKDRDFFQLLNELIAELGRQGFSIRFNAAIFIKSQLTIAGILVELDPDFKQGDYLMSRVSGQVFKETPTRLLRTIYFPAWNSHNYKSMMSNEDVKDVQWQRCGRTFKKIGKGIWAVVSAPAKLFS
jgi:ubiquinone biosynthesis protein